MRALECVNCGAKQFWEFEKYIECIFCNSRYEIQDIDRVNVPAKGIELSSDIERLLEKCRTDSNNASRYANRILDIDPSNTQALKYIRRR